MSLSPPRLPGAPASIPGTGPGSGPSNWGAGSSTTGDFSVPSLPLGDDNFPGAKRESGNGSNPARWTQLREKPSRRSSNPFNNLPEPSGPDRLIDSTRSRYDDPRLDNTEWLEEREGPKGTTTAAQGLVRGDTGSRSRPGSTSRLPVAPPALDRRREKILEAKRLKAEALQLEADLAREEAEEEMAGTTGAQRGRGIDGREEPHDWSRVQETVLHANRLSKLPSPLGRGSSRDSSKHWLEEAKDQLDEVWRCTPTTGAQQQQRPL